MLMVMVILVLLHALPRNKIKPHYTRPHSSFFGRYAWVLQCLNMVQIVLSHVVSTPMVTPLPPANSWTLELSLIHI